jgi:hypothetical protein
MESTRLAIVRQALDDILERLDEMHHGEQVLGLLEKARACDRVVRGWEARPPTEEGRASMLKTVLELNVEVMAAGKTQAR